MSNPLKSIDFQFYSNPTLNNVKTGIKDSLGYDELLTVEPIGLSGGLAVLWKIRENRQIVWDRLSAIGLVRDEAWTLVGDFNELRSVDEKMGGVLREERTFEPFRNMLENCNLRDIRHIGNWFSWVGKRGDDWVQCRLDRGIGNEAWFSNFAQSSVEYLPLLASDHRPIILKFVFEEESRGRGRFFYDKRWELEEGIEEVVRLGWHGAQPSSGQDRVSIADRLARCRTELSSWKRLNGFHSGNQLRLLQLALEDEMTKRYPNFDTIVELKAKLAKANVDEEKFWKTKSIESWLKEGDKNTKYIHRSVKGKRLKNKIVMLKDANGAEHFGESAKGSLAVDYFKDLFTSSQPVRIDELLQDLEPRVSSAMNDCLTASISPQEIKSAAFSIKSSSSPGFDGFSGAFYVRFWHIVGDALVKDIQLFFESCIMPQDWNHTQVCLIPKVPNPSKMVDLRPISLCSVHYKIISKILCDRLKAVLPEMVSETQGAFVQDRLISDNILVAHEITHALRTDAKFSSKYMAIKSDMSKAYDRVEWVFIERLLRKLGFNERWISWIMACVSSISYSILMNGRSHGFITPSRGLRQGDPMSPFLFILGPEALINLLNKSEADNRLTGLSFASTGPSINHLLFADDSLLVCKADINDSDELLRCLQLYCEASGQLINYQKSSIIFGSSVDPDSKAAIKTKLGIHVEGGDGTYLGLPECFSGSKRKLLGFIQEKLNNRLNGWFSKALSQGGKEILLKSIALALPVYAMSCFKLSKDLCKKLRSAMIEFWWSSGNNKKKISWVAWEKLCVSKEKGGLGFHDIELFNQSLLCKQAWRLLDSPNSLVSKVMKSRYYEDQHFLLAYKGTRSSYAWRSILHGRELMLSGLQRTIGNGRETYACTAKWILDGTPRAPFRTDFDVSSWVRVVDFIHRDTWTWNESFLRQVFVPTDVEKILRIKISRDVSDSFIWSFTKHGRYTSQSGYKYLVDQSIALNVTVPPLERALWKKLWKLRTTPKIKHFLWKVLHGALAVADRLQTRGLEVPSRCPMCNDGVETIAHLLFTCSEAKSVWELSSIQAPPSSFSSNSVFVNLHFLMERLQQSNETGIEFYWVLWQVWKARNALVFERVKWSAAAVLAKAKDDATQWKAVNDTVIEPRVQNTSTHARWSPPLSPFSKCNYGFKNGGPHRCAGLGWILRDVNGNVKKHARHSMISSSDYLRDELEGLLWMLTSLVELRERRVCVEVSSPRLVEAVTKPRLFPVYRVLLDDIATALRRIGVGNFSSVAPQANSIAFRIAESASVDDRVHSYIQIGAPSWLLSQVASETPQVPITVPLRSTFSRLTFSRLLGSLL